MILLYKQKQTTDERRLVWRLAPSSILNSRLFCWPVIEQKMEKALVFVLLSLVFPVTHAFVVRVVPQTTCSSVSTFSLNTNNFAVETQQVSLQKVTAQVEVALKAAREALKAETWPTTILETSSQDLNVLQEDIDNALFTANQAILDSSPTEEDLFDADEMLGEDEKLNVIELLSEGLLDSESFQQLVKQRKEEAFLLKQQEVEKARHSMEKYLKEAHRLKQQIKQTKIRRIQLKRFREFISIGMDGIMVGSVIGLYAWHAIPQYLGDNVAPVIPTFVTGGVMGCASIIASTTDTALGETIRKHHSPLDVSSRIKMLWAITIGMDGAMVGCAIAWHLIPQYYLGDNVEPARMIVLTIVTGGVMGCASIVAATSDTAVGKIIQKAPLGMASRTILWAITSMAEATATVIGKASQMIAAVPGNLASAVLVAEYKVKKERSSTSQDVGCDEKDCGEAGEPQRNRRF